MTLICFASQKGSPGTSAAALAVAAALRPGDGRRKLLLEADLSGGVLAIRYRLPTEPGLVTLAAAARAGLVDDELWRHVGELPGGLPAVVCPDGPEQVHSALAAAGPILGRHLADRRDIDVICDLGRLLPGSPAVDLAAEATALLMVARPTAEQLQPAARRLLALRPQVRNLGWLLVGEKPYGPADVESTFGFPVVGVLADDRRSVEAIEGGAVTRRVRRHPFVRSATTVASTLSGWLSPLAVSSDEVAETVTESDAVAGSIDRPEGRQRRRPAPPPPMADADRRLDPDLRDGLNSPSDGLNSPSDDWNSSSDDDPSDDDDPDGDSGAERLALVPPSDRPAAARPAVAMTEPNGTTSEETVGADVEPSGDPMPIEIEPPSPPSPPLPPAPAPSDRAVAPDPFVHDDGDIEWTGS